MVYFRKSNNGQYVHTTGLGLTIVPAKCFTLHEYFEWHKRYASRHEQYVLPKLHELMGDIVKMAEIGVIDIVQ